MSIRKIRKSLRHLLNHPDDSDVWEQLEESATADTTDDVLRELEMARMQHERMLDWPAVARLLELELAIDDSDFASAKQVELARIYHEELLRADAAQRAFQRAAELKPDDSELGRRAGELEFARANVASNVEIYLVQALDSDDAKTRHRMLLNAAADTFRYLPRDASRLTQVGEYIQQVLKHDSGHDRALSLNVATARETENWAELASALEVMTRNVGDKYRKAAAARQLAWVATEKLDAVERAVSAHQTVFEVDPRDKGALSFLSEHYSQREQWDYLVALYEDQLASGVVKDEEKLGAWVQLAMLNWRSCDKPAAAETYFEKVREVEPSHAGMVQFFRERCTERGDTGHLMLVLKGAMKVTSDDDTKAKLRTEIAALAKEQESAKSSIDTYRELLRDDPNDDEARDALRVLYLQTESYNALIELYRQDLKRLPEDDVEGRVAVLREMAGIYRERSKSDSSLLTVLGQIHQLDGTDVDAVRGLVEVYDRLGRARDHLKFQGILAGLTQNKAEQTLLLRNVARTWLEQFSNVKNAMLAYESLLEATDGEDVEAREKLRELYRKRRVWPKLYELYERQVETLEGDARHEMTIEMAKLAAERLNKGEEAIRLLKEVLVFSPNAPGVLDQLERQAERQKDHPTVAHVLDRRIDAAEDKKTKVQLLQKLGLLLADKIGNTEAANKAWHRVLRMSPGHKRALRVLRQEYVGNKSWDDLEELYRSQGDHEGLAEFLSTSADRSKDDAEKVELSFRAANVYETRVQAPERAARSYERVLSVDANDERAARALLPLYERAEKWSRIPALYAALLDNTEDVDEKIVLLHKMADITGGPLANKAGALEHAKAAYVLRPDASGLKALRDWSQQAGSWEAFVEVINERLASGEVDDKRSRSLRLMLAHVHAEQDGQLDEAVQMYRAMLEEDPDDEEAAEQLEGLLRSADRRDDLRWLFELKANRAEGARRFEALEEWARVEEEVFGEPDKAIELLEKVSAEDASRAPALAALARLQLGAEQYAKAAVTMAAHRDAADDAARVEIDTDLARLQLDHLGNPVAAFEAAERALAEDGSHRPAVRVLEELLDHEATQARAATSLEQIYAASGDADKRVSALTAMLVNEKNTEQRLVLCERLVDVHEHDLDNVGTAFEVMLSTLLEAPGELRLWDRAAQLSVTAGRPTDMAEAYRKHLADDAESAIGDEVRLELCERAAVLHEEQLGDSEGAVPYLNRVLALDANNERAFDRLKEVLNDSERWDDLEQLYERRIAVAPDDSARITLLQQAAMIAEEMTGNDEKAIRFFERIVEIDSLHAGATDALERLYTREERHAKLAALLEGRLETALDEEAAPTHFRLVELYLIELDQHDQVVPHLTRLLELSPNDLDARDLAEKCLDVPALRQPSAMLLDIVYQTVDDPRDLVRILEIRVDGADNDDDRRDLLQRIAELRDERLKDDAGAFDVLRMLLPLEPEDPAIRARMLEVGQRLGKSEEMAEALLQTVERCSVDSMKGEILLQAGEMYYARLDQPEKAIEVYNQALTIDPDDPELVTAATEALATIYQEHGDHAKLAEVLSVQVKQVNSTEERLEIYARIANLHEDLLDDDVAAIKAWQASLAEDEADLQALRALERLYERTEQWSELVEVLRQLEEQAQQANERKRCMVKAAEVLATNLNKTDDAIDAWRAVQDNFEPDVDTLAPLATLYQQAGRHEELGETYEAWLTLSDDLDERVDLYAKQGDVRRIHLDDPQGALSSYRQVLTLNPSHEGARAALEEMLSHPDAEIKREVAEFMGPLYEADGDAERLLKVLDIEIESTYEPAAKLQTLERALLTAEDTLDNLERAFEYACKGVREALGEPNLQEWIDNVERLAAADDKWLELMVLYEEVVDDILDSDVQQNSRLRAGELARTRLDDEGLAIKHYSAALEARSDDERALLALEALYQAQNKQPELLNILRQRAEIAATEEDRKELLFRVAELQRGELSDSEAAIRTYEDLASVALEPRALVALEELYSASERHDDLVSLYERQIDEDGDDVASVRVKIARVCHEKLSDTPRALDELNAALETDADHADAIALLETLLGEVEDVDVRGRVAEMLEPVYLRNARWEPLRDTYKARLDSAHDADQRGELLTSLATLYEEQLEDYSAALDTVACRLQDEPANRETWSEVERLGRVIGDDNEKRVAEIYSSALARVDSDDEDTARLSARTGELFAEAGVHDKALTFYRRAYAFEPSSNALFGAIDELLVTTEQHAERVLHHRAGLDEVFEDDRRVKYLHVIAELQRDRLDEAENAIDTYREVLDVDEGNTKALDALTALFSEAGLDDDLAELHDRRAELNSDPEQAAPYRLELAKLLLKKDGDRDRALDQLERIVADIPWHEGAIGELEGLLGDEERKDRIIYTLRPLYERSDNWKGLIKLNDERLSLTDLPSEQVEVLNNTARLWEDQGDDLAQAFDVTRRAFELAPDDEVTRANLERLSEALDRWGPLAESYETAVQSAEDEYVKRELYGRLSVICDERLDDPRRALAALRKLSDLDPSEAEPLEQMDMLCMLLADWQTLNTVVERKVENADADDERASLMRRLAELKRDMLEDLPGARDAYERSLDLEGDSLMALDNLIELHDEPMDENGDAQRLGELLEQRIEHTDPGDDLRHELLLRAADCYEKRLENAGDAIRVLQRALDDRPTDIDVLTALARLYRSEGSFDDLLQNLKTQASVSEDDEARIALRNEIGDLYSSELDSPIDALEQYRMVLSEDGSNAHAIEKVQKIGEEHEDQRIEVAELLEPVLTQGERHADLVSLLEMRLTAQSDSHERAETLQAIARVQEDQLEAVGDARNTLLRAMAETPDEEQLHNELNRLSEDVGDFAPYADGLTEQANNVFDALVQTDLYERLGRVAEEQLGDEPRAIDAYQKAVEQAESPHVLLAALDRLYLKNEQHEELANILERRVELSTEPAEQAELHYRLSALQIEHFGNKDVGLQTLRMVVDNDPEHAGARTLLESLTDDAELFEEAAEALETVYRVAGDNAARATLRNKRIDYADNTGDKVRLRLELAQMLEDETGDTKTAQQVVQQAFTDDPSDGEVRAQLERLAAINSDEEGSAAWSRAADAVGEAVAGGLEREREGRDGGINPELARELYIASAGWYRNHVEDDDAAEKRLGEALALDPDSGEVLAQLEEIHRADGRESQLVTTLRKLAALSDAGELDRPSAALRREAKMLAEEQLEDLDMAEQILRDMRQADDADPWALAELTKVAERKDDHQELYTLVTRRMELTADGAELRELRHRAAAVAAEKLDDREAAVDLYEAAFEDEPSDGVASKALRKLYGDLERNEDILRFNERLTDFADDPEQRAELRLESARICIEKLNAPTEGIEHLTAVLDEIPSHVGAVELLASMLEKEGRDDELADLYARQIDLAGDEGDQPKQLLFRVKQAELYETRLNDPERAIEGYQAVLAADDNFRPALEAVARLYEQQDETDNAAQAYEKLLHYELNHLDEGEAATRVRLAEKTRELFTSLDDHEAAARGLEVTLEAGQLGSDEVSQLRDHLRTIYRDQEDWGKLAALIASEASEADDDDEKVVLLRKAADIHSGKRDDHAAAAALLDQAVDLKPDDRDLMLALCDAYNESGRGKAAIEVLGKIVESYGGRRSKDLAEIHHRIAKAHLAEGDPLAAMKELENARKMDPGSVAILFALGTLSLRLAESDDDAKAAHLKRSANSFRSLLLQRLDSASLVSKSDVFYHLARVSHLDGDNKKAKQMAERALSGDKSHEGAKALLEELAP